MSVYVAAHKKYDVIEQQGYIPLQVGAALNAPLDYQRDDTGDNISHKNRSFCELTGLYWIWKNTDDEYKGLVHYRRYFVKGGKLLDHQSITELLKEYDFILPRVEILRERAYDEFCLHSGHEKDLVLLRQAVERVDSSVLPAFDKVFDSNRLHLYNMLITDAKQFDRYCEWLFDVLFELEKHVDMTDYTDYQKRLYGFLSERLLNVWVEHIGAKVCQLHVKNTEQTMGQSLRIFARRQKNRLLFKLGR